MWAAFQISLPVAISRTEPNDKPVASRRESKVPEPRQTSQFERPWDLFVPAKSVGKLTARMRVSKAISLVCAAKRRIAPDLRMGRWSPCGGRRCGWGSGLAFERFQPRRRVVV